MSDAIEQALAEIKFDADGLVPAIAQQHDTGEILMMAWMNREAIEETVATGAVCYWSRSRKALWRKGERSGQAQRLVEQTGVACHTGQRSCFFRAWRGGRLATIAEPLVSPDSLYGET